MADNSQANFDTEMWLHRWLKELSSQLHPATTLQPQGPQESVWLALGSNPKLPRAQWLQAIAWAMGGQKGPPAVPRLSPWVLVCPLSLPSLWQEPLLEPQQEPLLEPRQEPPLEPLPLTTQESYLRAQVRPVVWGRPLLAVDLHLQLVEPCSVPGNTEAPFCIVDT